MLAGLVCVGCDQPKKTAQTGLTGPVSGAPGDTVKPLTEPVGEVAPPGPVTNLTSLVPPEPKPVTPAVTPPVPGSTYTIKKGDTFIKIAREVYGDPSRMKDIAAANPGLDPRKLKVGQTIVLPDVGPLK
jgi:nucleoid-associated protein YgaU